MRRIGEKGSFIRPVHCTQHENYFFVSDVEDQCIKVLDKQGKFLYKFGVGDGDFGQPRCLLFDRAGHLLVCDLSKHRVQLFKLNGEFVTKVGEHSEEGGMLNGPFSTAILSDGRIIVTEYGNHRVTILE